jgi:hypothetical protein
MFGHVPTTHEEFVAQVSLLSDHGRWLLWLLLADHRASYNGGYPKPTTWFDWPRGYVEHDDRPIRQFEASAYFAGVEYALAVAEPVFWWQHRPDHPAVAAFATVLTATDDVVKAVRIFRRALGKPEEIPMSAAPAT